MMEKQTLKVGLAQFASVWLNRQKTIEKALKYAEDAAKRALRRTKVNASGVVSEAATVEA